MDEVWKAFEQLNKAIDNLEPEVPDDESIQKETLDYMIHMAPIALGGRGLAEVLLKELDAPALEGLLLASCGIVGKLYLSWAAKCKEIESLKVQLEAQEALHGESV